MHFPSDKEANYLSDQQQDYNKRYTCRGAEANIGEAAKQAETQWDLPKPLTTRENTKQSQKNIRYPEDPEQTIHHWSQGIANLNLPQRKEKGSRTQERESEEITKPQKNSSSKKYNITNNVALDQVDKAIQDIVGLQENRLEVLSNLEKIVHGVKRSLSLHEETERTHMSRKNNHRSDSFRDSSNKRKTRGYGRKEKKDVTVKPKLQRKASTPASAWGIGNLETPVRRLTPIEPPDSDLSSNDSYGKHIRIYRGHSTSSSSSQDERPSRSHTRTRRCRKPSRSRIQSISSDGRDSNEQERDFVKKMVAVLKGAGVGSGCGVPEPEVFTVSKGTSFSQFLNHFEKYCDHRYSSHKDYWVKELEKFLEGDIKDVYMSIRKPRTTYREIKEMLTEWYVDTRRHRISTKRIQFEQATRKYGEDLSVFAVRLESLAKEAYPKRDMIHSRELREKFLSAIPSKANKLIIAHNWQTKQITGHKLSWRQIKELVAMEYSITHKKRDTEEESDEEIYPAQQNYRNVYVGENKLEEDKPKETTQVTPEEYENKGKPIEKCQFCNKIGHKQEACRKKPDVCWECGGKNHLARHCFQRLKKNPAGNQEYKKFSKRNEQHLGNQQRTTQWNPQTKNIQRRTPQRWNNKQQQYSYPYGNLDQYNMHGQQQYWNQGQDQMYWQQQNNPSWSQIEKQQEN